MNVLQQLGVTVGGDLKASRIFEALYESFFKIPYTKPSEYIQTYWRLYQASADRNSNLNGKVFEYILATLFIREGILPLYISAKVAFVPNVIYDIMFYTSERGPICISAKTSLRERYKQADLEAIALKYVHRKALAYLITLEENEAASVRGKIKSGHVIGLDDVILASSPDFDNLIGIIKKLILSEPPTVKVIQSTQVITQAKVDALNL